MKRSSNYNDLLLKTFIRESFVQYKREDLFERKQNLIRERKNKFLIRERRRQKLFESFSEMCNNIDNILSEKYEKKYSIKNIFLENNNLEVLEEGWLEKLLLPSSKGFASYGYQDDPDSFDNTQIIKGVKKMYKKELEKINFSWENILKRAADRYDNLEKQNELPKSRFLPEYKDEDGKMQPSPMNKEETIANSIPPGTKGNLNDKGEPLPLDVIRNNYFAYKLPSHNSGESGQQQLMDEKEFIELNKDIYYDEQGQKQQYRLKMGIDKFSDFLNKEEVQQVIMALMLIPMAASKFSVKVPKITMPDGKKVNAQTAAQQLGLEKVVDKDGNFDKEEFKKVTGANDKQADETAKELNEMKKQIETQEDLEDLSKLDKAKKAKKVKKVKKVKKAPKTQQPESEPETQQQSEPETQQQSEPETQQQSEPETQKSEFENPSQEEIEKSIQDDLKGTKDGASSRYSVSEDAETNQKTFKVNQQKAESNKELGEKQSQEGKKEAIKNGDIDNNKVKVDLSEFDYDDGAKQTIKDIGEAIGSAIEGLGHGEIESKYQSDFDSKDDFRARISGQDKLGDASSISGQDTSSGKILASKGMKQLQTLSALKDIIGFKITDKMEAANGEGEINFDEIVTDAINQSDVKLNSDVKAKLIDSIKSGKINPNAIAYEHLNQADMGGGGLKTGDKLVPYGSKADVVSGSGSKQIQGK